MILKSIYDKINKINLTLTEYDDESGEPYWVVNLFDSARKMNRQHFTYRSKTDANFCFAELKKTYCLS